MNIEYTSIYTEKSKRHTKLKEVNIVAVIKKIKETPIVPVIRGANESNIIEIVEALRLGGINTIELTAETPRITTLIEKVALKYGEEVIVGAGTVLDAETARAVIMAGAQFIVTPSLNTDVIKMSNRYGILNVIGALTPTEIIIAYENGADMIKVFPADVFGAKYIKSIHGPFPHIPIMATGGIDLNNMIDYFEHGCEVVGLGSNLVNAKNLKTKEDYSQLTKRATDYVNQLQKMPK